MSHDSFGQSLHLAWGAVLTCALLLVFSLSGCEQQSSEIETLNAWIEPAWMAQRRSDVEEHNAAMYQCLTDRGAPAMVMAGAGVAIVWRGEVPEGAEQAWAEATAECDDLLGGSEFWTVVPDESEYARMLDVRSCLIAHGQTVAEPPSLDVWLVQDRPWNPHSELIQELEDSLVIQLLETCVQNGPGVEGFSTDEMFDEMFG